MSPCQVPVSKVSVPPASGVVAGGGAGPGVDAGQAGFYSPALGPFAFQTTFNVVAARTILTRIVCPKSMTISKIGFVIAAAASVDDACDVGIYNVDGTVLLGSSGSTTGRLNSTGSKTVNLQAPVSLVAGTVYHAAFVGAAGGTAAQYVGATIGNFSPMFGLGAMGQGEIQFGTGGIPLVAPFARTGTLGSCPIMALMQ